MGSENNRSDATEALEREFNDGLSRRLIESYREEGMSDERILEVMRREAI